MFAAVGALLVATMACSIFVGGPVYPPDAVPVSTESNLSIPDQVQQALVAGAQSGVISVSLSEGQLTSYLATKSAEMSNPVLTEPRVLLRSGQLKVYGKANTGIFTANVSITLQTGVDAGGQPQIQVVQTDFGPVAAPSGLNDALTSFARESLIGGLGPIATGFRLESISINDGMMTVTGRVK
jgi:hypothetical protein